MLRDWGLGEALVGLSNWPGPCISESYALPGTRDIAVAGSSSAGWDSLEKQLTSKMNRIVPYKASKEVTSEEVSSVSLDRLQGKATEKVTFKPGPKGKKELAAQSQELQE